MENSNEPGWEPDETPAFCRCGACLRSTAGNSMLVAKLPVQELSAVRGTEPIDEFESLFRRAEREPYEYREIPIASVVLVCDRSAEEARQWRGDVATFLPALADVEDWHILGRGDFRNVTELLERLDSTPGDLVVTWRHLFEESLVPQHSLGVYLDVLTQARPMPVLVCPGTAAEPASLITRRCDAVMVVTDHIAGDHRLVNYGVRMAPPKATLWLAHIEDAAVFARYMAAIERIPQIDTDVARRTIREQLLKEAEDYIAGCRDVLAQTQPTLKVAGAVAMGHRLKEYVRLVQDHEIDLLVANTKDKDQLAMHGMAYALAVELIDTPLLLL